MKNCSLKTIASWCSGQLTGCTGENIFPSEIVIDSRAAQKGSIFAAYRGENSDGYDYMQSAFDSGAVCCISDRFNEEAHGPQLIVSDVQKALEDISRSYKSTLAVDSVGITGSVGKTTAKEMISAVLSQRFNVLKTDKNYNNQIGVPLTVCRINPLNEKAVIEMGVSHPGDMKLLADIVRPDIMVFTVIGHAHLEFLHDLRGVFEEKTSVTGYMPDDGIVIINGDDPYLSRISCRQRVISYGLSEKNDIYADDIYYDADGFLNCRINIFGESFKAKINAFGKHMLYALLIGAAVGKISGLSNDEICKGFENYRTVGRRAAVKSTGSFTLIDDCYNSNPDSVKNAIDSLNMLKGRHVCVLGDMLELGDESEALHAEIGTYAMEKGVDILITAGRLSRYTAEAAGPEGRWYASTQELINDLKNILMPGDNILVKASNSSHFDIISDYILKI